MIRTQQSFCSWGLGEGYIIKCDDKIWLDKVVWLDKIIWRDKVLWLDNIILLGKVIWLDKIRFNLVWFKGPEYVEEYLQGEFTEAEEW